MKICESYCGHLFGFSVLVRKDRIIITFFKSSDDKTDENKKKGEAEGWGRKH